MRRALLGLLVVTVSLLAAVSQAATHRTTVVLAHGAFADGSSWNSVIRILRKDGYPVVAAALPLRSLGGDAQYLRTIVATLPEPVVLVGHSYAGSVISEAADDSPNVKGLVYVAAFAPEAGESAATLTGLFPGSTLGPTLAPPVLLSDGNKDLYVQQERFRAQFAADLPAGVASTLAATQRPVTDAALNEASTSPGWKKLPSWFIYGGDDRCIPAKTHAFMADRAHARAAKVIPGASHLVMISHPAEVAQLIEHAAGVVSAGNRD